MGVVDQILGQFVDKREGDEAQEAGYLEHVFAILHSKGGGLAGLVQAFHEKGLGDVVRSWIGTGANEPITTEQLESVFGREKLKELAGKAGISMDVFKAKLSEVLPMVVDKLTPDGKLPDASELDKQLGDLPKKG
jgi:uncharacterized protein YidB (DUF937 family)